MKDFRLIYEQSVTSIFPAAYFRKKREKKNPEVTPSSFSKKPHALNNSKEYRTFAGTNKL